MAICCVWLTQTLFKRKPIMNGCNLQTLNVVVGQSLLYFINNHDYALTWSFTLRALSESAIPTTKCSSSVLLTRSIQLQNLIPKHDSLWLTFLLKSVTNIYYLIISVVSKMCMFFLLLPNLNRGNTSITILTLHISQSPAFSKQTMI